MISFFITLFRFFMQMIYMMLRILPVQNKITMISRQSNNPNVDFLLLEKELSKSYKVVLLCKTLDGGIKASIFSKISYFFHMFRQMYHMATSKVVILDTYCILVSLLSHRKKLRVIQIWHSIGSMKKFGYSAMGNEEGNSQKVAEAMHMHENYDYVLCSSYAYREHLAKGFGCSEDKILEFPLPRIDMLLNETYQKELKDEITEKYKSLKDRYNVLYCPTFRKENDKSEKCVEELLKYLPENYNLIVKLHPLSEVELSDRVLTCSEYTTSQLFSVTDAVISDYSCVVYEAALLNIPLYFYAYDEAEYKGKRGLAIDYEKEMPSRVCNDAKTLMEMISKKDYDYDKLKKFTRKYVKETKHATLDIVNFINRVVGDLYGY